MIPIAALISFVALPLSMQQADPHLPQDTMPVPVAVWDTVVPLVSDALDALPPQLAEARDAITRGDIEQAITQARDYTWHHRDEERGYLVLGDAYDRRAVTGRYPAWRAFARAARLAPNDPAAPYGQAAAGWSLGPPDGERLAREGLERVLAVDPLYRDAWYRWSRLYRDDNGRRNVIAILEKHANLPEVAGWIAEMELELGADSTADTVLTPVLAHDSSNPVLLALAAQVAFDQGDSLAGWTDYRTALAHADQDSTDFLWHQVISIASPEEIRAWDAGIPADQKPGWLGSFWERRNPNLFSPINHRVAEHFERMRYALRNFGSLFHPLSREIRHPVYRDIHDRVTRGELGRYVECESTSGAGGRETRYLLPPGFLMDWLDQTVTMEDLESVSGRGAEGVAYLRFGPPRRVLYGAPNCYGPDDLIRWEYSWGELRFQRQNTHMVLRPLSIPQAAAAQHLLRHDASSVPEDLGFVLWTAQFRDTSAAGRTEVLVYTTGGHVIAELVGVIGGARVKQESRSGHVTLRDRPGSYDLLVSAEGADTSGHHILGRQRVPLAVRDMHGPAMSDLLLGLAWADTAPTRARAERHVFANLTFTSQDTIRAYSELYGLWTERGRARYQATYIVLKTDHPWEDAAKAEWTDGTAFTFTRSAVTTADGITREVLDLEPSMVGQGVFLLRLKVRDLVTGLDVGQTTVPFVVK